MNLATQIYQKACEAAATTVGQDFGPHELATKELELFNAQQLDPLDFPAWRLDFSARRNKLNNDAEWERNRLIQLGNTKAASESKPKAAPAAEGAK